MTPDGWVNLEERYQKLSQKNDFLPKLNQIIPWEEFRPVLEQVDDKPRKSNAGRKPFDRVLMFKLLVLQQLNNLSDEQLEYQVYDRFSFMQFLGLSGTDAVPDATTLWLFRQQLTAAGLVEGLFEQFEGYLQGHGYQAEGGQILDATLVPVPKQRISKEERQQLEQGEVPQAWQENPHRRSQKDIDASWTKKNDVSHFGYKNHISIDVEYGLVRRYSVTAAAVHDSVALPQILDDDNSGDAVWADSAYRSALIEWFLALLHWYSQIHERGYRQHPLTEQQKQHNRAKSKIRAKVEHVFGAWVNEMGGKLIRSIGLERARTQMGLKNLAYNLKRFVYLETQATQLS
jgi:transposase, IS5 family